jgi:hypothetical protein
LKVEEILDSDDDLVLKLLQVKRPAAKKPPLGTSPSKSNKMVMTSNKGTICKPHCKLIPAQNLWKAAAELLDKSRTKHA